LRIERLAVGSREGDNRRFKLGHAGAADPACLKVGVNLRCAMSA
jgi:hypothetical protein